MRPARSLVRTLTFFLETNEEYALLYLALQIPNLVRLPPIITVRFGIDLHYTRSG